LLAYSKEIADQLVRETGSIRAKAQWEVQISAREFLEAASLGSEPQGILTASLEPGRQSIAKAGFPRCLCGLYQRAMASTGSILDIKSIRHDRVQKILPCIDLSVAFDCPSGALIQVAEHMGSVAQPPARGGQLLGVTAVLKVAVLAPFRGATTFSATVHSASSPPRDRR
jgi:hypothetical protein